jgi:hypothetical protein
VTPKSSFSQVVSRNFSEVRSEYGSWRTTTSSGRTAGGGAAGAPAGTRASRIFNARRACVASADCG